jgi:hypothetical protein
MTGYIDDISSVAAILLLGCAIAAALFRRSFPSIVRLLSAAALGTAATITLLFAIFVVAVVTSAPPRFARYDAVSTVCVLLTFFPPQLLWLPAIRRRVCGVVVVACLTFVPTLLSIGLLRSSAQPFYFPHP